MKAKRKSVRFNSEPGTTAQIELLGVKNKKAKLEHQALVITEAQKGCSIVLVHAPVICVGDQCRVQVGELAPLLAEVRWVIPLDEHIQKIGFQYLE